MRKHLLAFLAIPLAMMSMQVQAEDVDKSSLVSDIALDGWTCTGSDTWHVNTGWSDDVATSDGSGMTGPFMEYWIYYGNGTLSDATITKTLTGLDEGTYVFTALVRTLYEGGGVTPSGATIIANNGSEDCCAGATCTNGTYGTYSVTGVVGSDGQLVVGFKLASVNFNWLAFKDMTLTYKGVVLDDMKAALATLIAQCADYDGVKMAADVSTALTSAKNSGQSAYDATYETDAAAQEAYSSAIGALNTAISNADASVSVYATAANVLAQMKTLTESTNVYTADALEEYYGQWQTKYTEGTLTADEASSLVNPYQNNGWHNSTLTLNSFLLSAWDDQDSYDDYYVNTWSTEGDSDGSEFKIPFIEYWTGSGSLGAKTLTATVSDLPEGYYSVTALVKIQPADATAAYANGVTLQVNDGTAVDVCSNNTQYGSAYVGEFKAIGQVGSDGTLEIKFIVADNSNISWLCFQNVNYATVGDPKVGDATITPAAGYVDVSDLNAVTFSFKDAESAVGEFQILNENGVTCGDQTATLSLSGTTLTATFADLAAVRGQGYTVQIAAGTVGYSDGTTTYASNEAASAEYTVALLADGLYYLYDTTNKTFLSMGADYLTAAVCDDYGMLLNVALQSDGCYTFQFVETDNYLFDAVSEKTYTDNTTNNHWVISSSDETLVITNGNETSYKGQSLYNNGTNVINSSSNATSWKLMTSSERNSVIAAAQEAQETSVASAASAESVADYIASRASKSTTYVEETTAKEYYMGSRVWSPVSVSLFTAESLPEGIYKIHADAFFRSGYYNEQDKDAGRAYIKAVAGDNTYKMQIASPFDMTSTSTTEWSSVTPADVAYDGNYYPNNTTSAAAAMEAGNYGHDLYVYVGSDGGLVVSLDFDGFVWGSWLCYNNVSLTQYYLPTVDITEAGKLEEEDGTTYYYATYSTPAAVDLSQCEFEAYSVTTSGTELTYTKQEGIVPEGTALVIRGTEAKTYDVAVTTSEGTAIASNDLQVADGTTTGDGSTIYILANGSQGLGWYICTDGTTINEGKCYLTIASSNGAKFIGIGDVASGIAGVATSQSSTSARYNLSGQRVDGSYKGIVIENGKKYLLK